MRKWPFLQGNAESLLPPPPSCQILSAPPHSAACTMSPRECLLLFAFVSLMWVLPFKGQYIYTSKNKVTVDPCFLSLVNMLFLSLLIYKVGVSILLIPVPTSYYYYLVHKCYLIFVEPDMVVYLLEWMMPKTDHGSMKFSICHYDIYWCLDVLLPSTRTCCCLLFVVCRHACKMWHFIKYTYIGNGTIEPHGYKWE